MTIQEGSENQTSCLAFDIYKFSSYTGLPKVTPLHTEWLEPTTLKEVLYWHSPSQYPQHFLIFLLSRRIIRTVPMEVEGDTSLPLAPFTSQLTCCAAENWVTIVLFCRVRNAATLRSDATGGRIQAALLDPTFVSTLFSVGCNWMYMERT